MLIKFEVNVKLSVICILCLLSERLEQVLDAVRGECRLTKDTHDFKEGSANLEVVFDDGNEAIGDDGDMNLYAHSIFGFSPEPLDLKIQLDPYRTAAHGPSPDARGTIGKRFGVSPT